jgi:hypothetical protein
MLDWIKQAFGSFGDLQIKNRLGPGILEPLAQDLGRLKKHGEGFPAKALAYVVDDVGGDIPALIRQSHVGRVSYSDHDHDRVARQTRWSLYNAWDAAPPDFWIRFGSILAADSPILARQQSLTVAQRHPWIEALCLDLTGNPVTHYGQADRNRESHALASMARLESLLEAVGLPRSALVASVFQSPSKGGMWIRSAEFVAAISGFEASAVRDADLIRGAFRDPSFENRAYALRLIGEFSPEGLKPFAEELVALSLDSSSLLRAAAIPLALRAGPAAADIAQREAVAQKPEGRSRALQLLWEFGGDALRTFVTTRGADDAALSVRKTVEALVARAEASETASEIPLVEPEISLDLARPLTDVAEKSLREIFRINNESVRQQREKTEEKWKKNWTETSPNGIEQIIAQVIRAPENGVIRPVQVTFGLDISKLVNKWAKRDDIVLAQLVRLLIAIQWISGESSRDTRYAISNMASQALSHFGRTPGRASLLALEELFSLYHVPTRAIALDWFSAYGRRLATGWPRDAIWPYFARHRELLTEALNPASAQQRDYWFARERVFDALEAFPEPPRDLVPLLFDLALGGGKSDRAGAQRVLNHYPGKIPRIIEALESGKAEVRLAAASWLAGLGASEAVPAIEAALARERHDGAAGAMMSALESLGVPVAKFLNRANLEAEAKTGLKKGVPADLAWFPFDGLPPLEWADTGERLPADIGRWWVIQSHKLKSPEPGGVLRQYFAALRPPRREAFALYVLQAWLREDVKPIPREQAERLARQQASQIMRFIKQYPEAYTDAQKALTEDQFYEAYLPACLQRPAGSAAASKGVLAVVAAGGGSDIAPVVQRFLKEWYGTRASQGKSLIQMLAWVNHSTATQLVLSIGSRFRTKSFQEEATRQAQLMAERRNWTLNELADRTIPTAGFDSDGVAEIDYGTRSFTARLLPHFDIELFSPEGKSISSLPDARKDEDEARVKEAKKQWSAARRELKGVLQLQKDRLYEALCTERTWIFADWDTYLNKHPIVRRYCQQLIWVIPGVEGKPRTFRPLDDGSLTDVEDNPVSLDPTVVVALAHDSNLTAAESAAWQRHLADYKIDPLFQQLGKGVYRLPADQAEATEIEDFKGHTLDAFALRGRASKLGYSRGPAEDGGWFMRYEKRFPTLGIEAHVEFTGNSLPEDNRKVALLALTFMKKSHVDEGPNALALGEVPRVLLSECWNDVRVMAADGNGFDPDWQKATELQ